MKHTIPKLRKETNVTKIHGEHLIDDYAWIKQKNWQEVLKKPKNLNPEVQNYLEAENNYTQSNLQDLDLLKEEIFKELKGRIKDKDSSVPMKDGEFFYYTEYEEGSEYPCYKRINSQKKIETIFDSPKRAKGQKFFNLASLAHSHNHQYIAYNIDKNGSENYSLSVENLTDQKIITSDIPNTTGEIIWDPNNTTIYYIGLDHNQRPNKIYQHHIGDDFTKDKIIFEEKDPAFFCSISLSQSKKFLLIRTADHQTSEYYLKNLSNQDSPLILFSPRIEKEEYEIDHSESYFYILTNQSEAKNFKIMICEEKNFSKEN